MFGEILTLFASTEVFIYVFMEIVTAGDGPAGDLQEGRDEDYASFIAISDCSRY